MVCHRILKITQQLFVTHIYHTHSWNPQRMKEYVIAGTYPEMYMTVFGSYYTCIITLQIQQHLFKWSIRPNCTPIKHQSDTSTGNKGKTPCYHVNKHHFNGYEIFPPFLILFQLKVLHKINI